MVDQIQRLVDYELLSYFRCVLMLQIRWYAYKRPNEQPGLIGRFIENLKEGFERNKEMQVGSKDLKQSFKIKYFGKW